MDETLMDPELAPPVPTDPMSAHDPAVPVETLDDEEVKDALKNLTDDFERTDRAVRDRQLNFWRYLDFYWRGIQRLFWNEKSTTWSTPNGLHADPSLGGNEDSDPASPGRTVNVYRAHGESIIAALSASIPRNIYAPEDADNPDDITTAKAAGRVAQLIENHNDATYLWMRALFILYNQGLVAAYNYHHQDKLYGTAKVPTYGMQQQNVTTSFCADCGSDEVPEVPPQDPMMPPVPPPPCPNCGGQVMSNTNVEDVPVIEKWEDVPKTRERIEVFGPMHVKIPSWVHDMEAAPYLILEHEAHYTQMRKLYPAIADKIAPGGYEKYDRWVRDVNGSSADQGLVTVRRCWIRNWAFNSLKDLDDPIVQKLEQLYPDGCYVVFINDEFAEATNESMDDHWTVSMSPTSELIHADPVGQPLLPIQEMTNDLTDLTMETIMHGIPENFADPDVLDFKQYEATPARPGQISPAKAKAGTNLDQSFATFKPSTLSQEVDIFAQRLEAMGQFVVGSFPSIYGGPGKGSETLGEYQQSKSQNLQRLGLIWKSMSMWWCKVMEKGVKSYVKNSIADDKLVKKSGNSFINVWVRQIELEGRLGQVEPESSDQFPTTWAELRGTLMEILQLQVPEFSAAIFHPENTSYIARLLGFNQLHVPGDNDRNAQLQEIAELIKTAPVGEQPGMYQSTIPPDPDVDNHEIHVAACLAWLTSEAGLDAKKNNSAGYYNVVMHVKEHKMILMSQMAPAPAPGPGGEQKAEPSPVDHEAAGSAPPPGPEPTPVM